MKKHCVILGAGRVSQYVFEYLVQHFTAEELSITIYETNPAIAHQIGQMLQGRATIVQSDFLSRGAMQELWLRPDVIISLLPARLHPQVADIAIAFGCSLIMPSYLSPELRALVPEFETAGCRIIVELGLDPGIDHMSTMLMKDEIEKSGGRILDYRSLGGGLVAKHNLNAPWNYKVSWNPGNIARSGKDGGLYLRHGKENFTSYHRLYQKAQPIWIEGEAYDWYPNRNSLPYRELYGMEETKDFVRGTLRYPPFCRLWSILVGTGLCTETQKLSSTATTWAAWILDYFGIPGQPELLVHCLEDYSGTTLNALEREGVLQLLTADLEFPRTMISTSQYPVDVLAYAIERLWQLGEEDADRIVMQHRIVYEDKAGQKWERTSLLDRQGLSKTDTAMSKSVGLPVAIVARLEIQGQFSSSGLIMPVDRVLYQPVMNELALNGISFEEKEKKYKVD